MSAVGTQIDRGASTIAGTSSMTATGVQIDLGSATIAGVSSMTATGTQIDKGASIQPCNIKHDCHRQIYSYRQCDLC